MTKYRFKLLIPAIITMLVVFVLMFFLSLVGGGGGKTDFGGWIIFVCFFVFILIIVYFIGLTIDITHKNQPTVTPINLKQKNSGSFWFIISVLLAISYSFLSIIYGFNSWTNILIIPAVILGIGFSKLFKIL